MNCHIPDCPNPCAAFRPNEFNHNIPLCAPCAAAYDLACGIVTIEVGDRIAAFTDALSDKAEAAITKLEVIEDADDACPLCENCDIDEAAVSALRVMRELMGIIDDGEVAEILKPNTEGSSKP